MPFRKNLLAGDAVKRFVAITVILWSLLIFLRAYTSIQLPLIDDAYITYRYAHNFANGQGLVYNPGERVLGTTTPGYALVLGSLASVVDSENTPSVSQFINAISTLLTATNAMLIAYRVTRSILVCSGVVALILVNYNLLYAGIAGMESTVFLALVSGGLALMVYGRWWWAAALFGIVPYFRPEGLFIIGLFMLHVIVQRWRLRRTLGLFALALAPGILLAVGLTFYYGSPVPQSIVAKRAGLYPHPVDYTLRWMSEYVVEALEPLVPADRIARVRADRVLPLLLLFSTTYLIGITVLATFWLANRSRVLWIVPILNGILLVFFATSRTNIFEHYYALFEPMLLICWWIALYMVINFIFRRVRIPSVVAALVAFGLVFVPQAEKLYNSNLSTERLLDEPSILRMVAYADLAQALLLHLPPETVIALPEIGVLGYVLADMHIMDTAGLVTQEAVDYFPVPLSQRRDNDFGVIPPQMVKDMRPDMMITLQVFIKNGLLDDPWLWDNYAISIQLCNPDLPWESCLYVFTRHDLVAAIDLEAVASQFTESYTFTTP